MGEGKKTVSNDKSVLNELIGNLGGVIYVVQNNRIVFHNQQFNRLLGYSDREVKDLNFTDIVHAKDRKLINLLFSNRFEEIRQKSSRSYTFRALHRNGELLWLKSNVSLIQWNGEIALLDNCFDITQQKEVEEKLVEEEQNFRLLVNGFEDMIFIVNRRGVIVQANQSVYDRLGYPEHQIILRNFTSLFAVNYRERLRANITEAFGGKRITLNDQIVSQEGNVIPLEMRLFHGNWSQKEVVFAICQDITNRLEAEQTIRLSEEKFGKAFENNAVMMMISTFQDNRMLDTNETFLNTVELPKDQVIGKRVEQLNLFPELDHVSEIKRQILDEGRVSEVETILLTPSKRKLVVNFSMELIDIQGELCLLTIMSDITQKKQAEERITLSEQRFRQLAHLLPEKVFEADAKGYITFANQYLQVFFGFTEQLLNNELHITQLFDHQGQTVIKNYLKSSKVISELPSVELNALKADGTTFPALTHITAVVEKGKLTRYMGVMVDISARKEQEMELIRAKVQAENASKAKEEFLSTMSHEIRTPMNAVIGMTDILIKDKPLEHQLEHLRALKYSAQGLMALLNDILDISKIESGKLTIDRLPMNPKELAQAVWHSHKHIANKKGVELLLQVDEQIPECVLSDSVRLNQVLTNLTSNAIKFTEKGSVTIALKRVKETARTVSIHFSVVDTGIGIAKNRQKEVFDEFMQANHLRTKEYGGTGLGLAISQKLAGLLKGTIELESELGKGSNFFFTLTFTKAKAKVGTALETQPETMEVAFKQEVPFRILIVEDNEINSYIANRYLTDWGIDTVLVENGELALERVKNEKFDLILMDLEMPVMNGYQATNAIRNLKDKTKSGIPIVALTATAVAEVQSRILEIGMNDYVLKPFNPTELKIKIAKLLKLL